MKRFLDFKPCVTAIHDEYTISVILRVENGLESSALFGKPSCFQ